MAKKRKGTRAASPKKPSSPKTSAQRATIRPGMFVRPKADITPCMIQRLQHASDCQMFGTLGPDDVFRVIEIEGLSPETSWLDIDQASPKDKASPKSPRAIIDIPMRAIGTNVGLRPSGAMVIKQVNGSAQLTLSGREAQQLFTAVD